MFAIIPLLGLLVTSASAANDWSKPCFSGVCEYDLPPTNGTASGTLKIWGAQGAISDITQAAGWEILDCSPHTLQQNIRLVCRSNGASRCANLFSGSSGASGKIVRLPESCGKGAFAVVTKSYTPADQSVPAVLAPAIARRDGSMPQVQGLTLASKWSSVNPPSSGPVYFSIQAANVPGAKGTTAVSQRRGSSRVYPRGAFSDFISKAIHDLSSLTGFNVTTNKDLPPLDVDKSFNLVDQKISCPSVGDAGIKIDVDAKAHAVASIGLAASGTILPPVVSDFAVIVNLNAELSGELLVDALASASLDTGKLSLLTVAIPGLDFPGILTIGPSFKIDAQAIATLDANIDMTVGLDFKVVNAQLVFPPKDAGKNGGTFNIEDTPLLLSVNPNATASGTVEAHIIPSLNLGVTALGNVVDAGVFLELDASASLDLAANATASAGGGIGINDPSGQASANATFAGCVDIGAGLDVNVGAFGKFFGIFDASTKASLFSGDWDLFKKCFATSGSASTPKRSLKRSTSLPVARGARAQKRAFTLSCPAVPSISSNALQTLVDQTIGAASIKAV